MAKTVDTVTATLAVGMDVPPRQHASLDPAVTDDSPPELIGQEGPAQGRVQVESWSCSPLEAVEPQGLAATYWFDAEPTGVPYPMTVEFVGRRISDATQPGEPVTVKAVQSFTVTPGTGRVAVTARLPDLTPGEWSVTALPTGTGGPRSRPAAGRASSATATGSTVFLPATRALAPGVRLAAWPLLVLLGFLVGVTLQWLLAAQRELPAGRLLAVSVVAGLVGLFGAKAYYLLTHRTEKRSSGSAGMSIQGFVLAAVVVLLIGGWWAGVPAGQVLDVSAPGLLFGQAIGRLGCLFGGCCVGRPTASRWGIWSSDRRIGVRRIPVQLLESAVAWAVAASTLLAAILVEPAVDGVVFLGGFGAYLFGRQLLFPLRAVPRSTTHGTRAMLVISGAVVLTSLVIIAA